jgi:DNA-binding NtrC family response regulator
MTAQQPLRIAHLDDDALTLDAVAKALRAERSLPPLAMDGHTAAAELLAAVERRAPDVAIVDLHLGDGDRLGGLHVIAELRRRCPDALVIALSSDLRQVKAALDAGARDFVTKGAPAEVALRLKVLLAHAAAERRAESEAPELPGATAQALAKRAARIVPSAIRAVHVYGETGTGKDVVALLFERTLPPGTPFVKVNCAALSRSLLESELFGHAKGAFTGADAARAGYVEAAAGGWLFLDEVHHLPATAQAALLRALESGEVVRIGESKARPADVKVLNASNRRLEEEVARGRFLPDLWQRLREAVIEVPPLRERLDEAPGLIAHFAATESGGPYRVSREAMAVLERYDWREGNVRELRNCVRAMTELRVGHELTAASLPAWLWERLEGTPARAASARPGQEGHEGRSVTLDFPAGATLEAMSTALLRKLVDRIKREIPRASYREVAEALGVPKSTLMTRLKKSADAETAADAEDESE